MREEFGVETSIPLSLGAAQPQSAVTVSASQLDAALIADIHAVSQIDAIASILEVVCRVTGMGFAAVARVTPDRWVACAVRDEIAFGLLPGGELAIETTICDEIRASGRAVVIDHVAEDEQFKTHRTPQLYGFQSYISTPIVRPNGAFFGTLCAIDPRPARLNRPEIIGMFKNFADLIAFHLDAKDRAADRDAALLGARQAAELREQFVAVLAHDLRNPLASIGAGTDMLLRRKPDERAHLILGHVQESVRRMARLIDDTLDFARGRLGGGFPLELVTDAPLAQIIQHVIDESRAAWPNEIEAQVELTRPVTCDPNRIAQLLSNLLGNALKHGAPDRPIQVRATTDDLGFELSVSNHGDPLDPVVLARLFQPYFRNARSSNRGLGLGLYIASEIARAHRGTLSAWSTPEETRFTLRIPRE
jgi:signal transduction histidine kinase